MLFFFFVGLTVITHTKIYIFSYLLAHSVVVFNEIPHVQLDQLISKYTRHSFQWFSMMLLFPFSIISVLSQDYHYFFFGIFFLN